MPLGTSLATKDVQWLRPTAFARRLSRLVYYAARVVSKMAADICPSVGLGCRRRLPVDTMLDVRAHLLCILIAFELFLKHFRPLFKYFSFCFDTRFYETRSRGTDDCMK